MRRTGTLQDADVVGDLPTQSGDPGELRVTSLAVTHISAARLADNNSDLLHHISTDDFGNRVN